MVVSISVGCRTERVRTAHAGADTVVGAETTVAVAKPTVGLETGPAEIVRRYYDDIRNGRYDSAYVLWDGAGKASGQTPEQFARGFAQTAKTFVTIGDSVSIEGAAGSQYATVPVTVEAVLRSGAMQHFAGEYTLRRAMVDGATAEQRRWRIYSAHLDKR